MDLSNIQNSKKIEVINLTSDSSTASPIRIITSPSPKEFMNQTTGPEKQIDNIANKIKDSNKDLVEQTPQNTQSKSETDYANIITMKKVDRQPAKEPMDISTQQSTTTPQPQHSSTPNQLDEVQQQNVEHDSTLDIENEPELDEGTATTDQQQTHPSNQAREGKVAKLSK